MSGLDNLKLEFNYIKEKNVNLLYLEKFCIFYWYNYLVNYLLVEGIWVKYLCYEISRSLFFFLKNKFFVRIINMLYVY